MKRVRSTSDPRPQVPASNSPILAELMHGDRLDMHLQLHRDIWDLAARQPSATMAQTREGPDCLELLQECISCDWVKTFGHIAALARMTDLPEEITGPSPELIVHLLRTCPQIVDMTLDEFFVDDTQIPDLEAALSDTQHLRRFHLIPEDVEPDANLGIVRGLRSHHHMTSWRHWTENDPAAIVPELAQTLSGMQNLQCLDLCIEAPWGAEHFEQIAHQFVHMPALRDLRLSLAAGCDISSLFQTAVASGAVPLSSLTVNIARASAAETRNTAIALIQAIASLPRLVSLRVSLHVFEAMDSMELIRAIRRNGAFDTLTLLDTYGEDLQDNGMPGDVAAALRTNRNRFDLAPVGMMDSACSAFVNVVLAQRDLGPVSDIGTVLSAHLTGQAAAPDLRDCQGLLRVSKKIWEAARDERRQAMLLLLETPSTSEAMASHMLHLLWLGRKFHILGIQEAAQLLDLHSHWLRREPAAFNSR
jgi:hypothetical protein